MFYSFKLTGDRPICLVFNEGALYCANGGQTGHKLELDDCERFILERIVKQRSFSLNPVNISDLEQAYQQAPQVQRQPQGLDSVIRLLNDKFRQLLNEIGIVDMTKPLIEKLANNNYCFGLDVVENQSHHQASKRSLTDFKPNQAKMLNMFFAIYRSVLGKKLAKIVIGSLAVFCLFYLVQATHLRLVNDEDAQCTEQLAKQLFTHGCHSQTSLDAFNQALNLDSVVLISDHSSCVIDQDGIELLTRDAASKLRDMAQFTYTEKFDSHSNTLMVARTTLRSLENIYQINLWPIEVRAFRNGLYADGLDAAQNKVGLHLYTITLDDGAQIALYGHNLILAWLSLLCAVIIMGYGKCIARYMLFCRDWSILSYKLEKVIDTESDKPIYYEVLTRVGKHSPLRYIENLAANKLVTFHTVLIAQSIANARRLGSNTRFGINICPSSLLGNNFTVLEKYLLRSSPHGIVLELTENSQLAYSAEIYQNIAKLKSYGFDIALDDFGTGNNNVEVVSQLQLDYLKVDKEFIKDIESSTTNQRLLLMMSEIGQLNNCSIIYEGVETEEQKETLRKFGYNLHQGYLYS